MAILFYIFASLMITGSILVVYSRNPVHSVLWLIFTFCNASGLMVLIGAEFLAMMLIIIYVGAIAVLFLFVLMMLDIKASAFKPILDTESGLSIFICLLLFADLLFVFLTSSNSFGQLAKPEFVINPEISNSKSIGMLLYTDFILPFQTCGIILFVAMIASIVLTVRLRPGVKRQQVANQLLRNKANSLQIVKVKSHSGINDIDYDRNSK